MAKRPPSSGSGRTPLEPIHNLAPGSRATFVESCSRPKAAPIAASSTSLGRNVFAFGPQGRYLFNSQTQRAHANLPRKLQKLFDDNLVGAIYSAAFGKGATYFISYHVKNVGPARDWQNVPSRLDNWLQQERLHPRVSFGPDNSFFAWDQNGCCWQDLPEELEIIVQKWFSGPTLSTGHTPFKWVSLGRRGSFVAISAYSIFEYNLNGCYPELESKLRPLKPPSPNRFSTESAYSVWLNPFENSWALLNNETRFFEFDLNEPTSVLTEFDRMLVGYSIAYPEKVKVLKPALEAFKDHDAVQLWDDAIQMMHEQKIKAEREVKEVKEEAEKAKNEAEKRADKIVKQGCEKADKKVRDAVERAERLQKAAMDTADKKVRDAVERAERLQRAAMDTADKKVREAMESVGRYQREAMERAEQRVREAMDRAARVEREAMEKVKEARAKAEREAKEQAKREQKYRVASEESETRAKKRKNQASEIDTLYRGWVFTCENASRNITELEVFPSIPHWICTCTQCAGKKHASAQKSRRVCRHDVEKFLRCDEAYSWAWLRQKRNMWHSDKWCRAPPKYRDEFKQQAEDMFIIYGQLMDDFKVR